MEPKSSSPKCLESDRPDKAVAPCNSPMHKRFWGGIHCGRAHCAGRPVFLDNTASPTLCFFLAMARPTSVSTKASTRLGGNCPVTVHLRNNKYGIKTIEKVSRADSVKPMPRHLNEAVDGMDLLACAPQTEKAIARRLSPRPEAHWPLGQLFHGRPAPAAPGRNAQVAGRRPIGQFEHVLLSRALPPQIDAIDDEVKQTIAEAILFDEMPSRRTKKRMTSRRQSR